MKSQWLFVIFYVLALPLLACAQTSYTSPETGEKPTGTYFMSDIDSVSLTNGNLHLHIPLISLPGREVAATFALDYDSQFYEARNVAPYGSNNPHWAYESMEWRKSA